MKRSAAVAVGALSIMALSACGQDGSGVALLDQPPTAADELPAGLPTEGIQPGSARYAGTAAGISFFLARQVAAPGATSPGTCIVAVELETVSCGGGNAVEAGYGAGRARVIPDGVDAAGLLEDSWTAVHPNLLVRGFQAP